ncbi:hypothetical protein Tco_0462866 [Tanacetum coccineum]
MFTRLLNQIYMNLEAGSNDDITNLYECDQTLNVGAGTANLSAGPNPNLLTPGPISSGLVPNSPLAIPYVPPTNKDLELLFQPMFDEYFETLTGDHQMPHVPAVPPLSFLLKYIPVAETITNHLLHVFACPDPTLKTSSSGIHTDLQHYKPQQSTQPHEHLRKWTDSHPLDNIIGNPSRPVSTRKQLATDALWCFYNSVLSKVEPKNFKSVVTEDCWFQAMQDEIYEFDRLDVWELVPPPDCAMIIALKWIYNMYLLEGKISKLQDEDAQNKSNIQNCADNMANENVPSSFTVTTETTSTLPPPPPPPQQSTVHRDIW